MRLNNKGYMLVEIIVASVLAFSIAYYLLNLTYKFKDVNEDVYYSEIMLSNKINITKNIMNDLDKYNITGVECSSLNDGVVYLGVNASDYMAIKIDSVTKTIEYGKTQGKGTVFITSDSSYYKKKLEDYVEIGNSICSTSLNGKVVTLKVPISNIYEDKDYGIKLIMEANN